MSEMALATPATVPLWTLAPSLPFLSVIMPVRNEAAFIGATLEQLLGQSYPPDRFEVLVADGGSTDATREVVAGFQARHPNLILVPNPKVWSSAGRNAAVRAARGQILLLVDGHCQIEGRHYLAEVAAAFARSGADCVGRPQPLDVSGANRLQRAVAVARSSRLGHHPASHIYSDAEGFVPPQSVAVAYRRSVFEKVGLFDEDFDACEDVEFNHRVARAGLRCFFTPRVRLPYVPRSSLRGVFRQMVRYGRGRMRLFRKHRDTFSLPGFLPAAFVAGVAAGPLLALAFPVLAPAYAVGLGVYAATLLLFSLGLALRGKQPDLLPLLPLVFLAVHFGAGAGILWEAAAGSRRPRETADVLPEHEAPRRRAA
jgi:glycosyltransferase involved in cell wall biosynthesis